MYRSVRLFFCARSSSSSRSFSLSRNVNSRNSSSNGPKGPRDSSFFLISSKLSRMYLGVSIGADYNKDRGRLSRGVKKTNHSAFTLFTTSLLKAPGLGYEKAIVTGRLTSESTKLVFLAASFGWVGFAALCARRREVGLA